MITLESSTKIKPLCSAFGTCGGCLYQDISYEEELIIKQNLLKSLIQEKITIDEKLFHPIIASPKRYYYRSRIDLRLKKIKTKEIFIGFTPAAQRRGVVAIDNCSIADENIGSFIPELKNQAIAKLPEKYRMANLTVRTSDDGRVFWGGIGRRSLQQQEQDYLWTTIEGRKIFFSLDTFFQANLSILPELFKHLHTLDIWSNDTIFYDLYGGVGLFSLGLIDLVKESILIEDNPASIKLAQYNTQYHKLNNFTVIEGKVEDKWSELLQKKGNHVAMIDPPRAGLSLDALKLITNAKELHHILYLSCNPESLARDLVTFIDKGWEIQTITPLDFFPKTRHLETLVLLKGELL